MHSNCRCEVPCNTTTGYVNWDAWLFSLPPPAYRDGDRIVTPGYHFPQGDSSMSWDDRMTCGDPRCDICHPYTAAPNSVNLASMLPSGTITMNFEASSKEIAEAILNQYRVSSFDLGMTTKNKEQSMSATTKRVINDLRELDESELPYISSEVEAIKRRKKDRIAEGLDGVADLETLKDPGIRRFVIAYYQDGESRTAKGVEFGVTDLVSKDDVEKLHRVYVQGRDFPACGAHYTMPALRKKLEDNNIVFRIAYYSED